MEQVINIREEKEGKEWVAMHYNILMIKYTLDLIGMFCCVAIQIDNDLCSIVESKLALSNLNYYLGYLN